MKSRIRTALSLIVISTLIALALGGAAPASLASTVWSNMIVQGVSTNQAAAAVSANGGQVTARIDIINAVVAKVPSANIARLNNTAGVVRATIDQEVQAAGAASAADFSTVVGADQVWATGDLGQGVTVASLDSGIESSLNNLRQDASHQDRILAYYDVFTGQLYDQADVLQSPRDPSGHGSHVFGIIANSDANSRGIAPDVKLVAVRVLDQNGMGTYANVLQGLNWVVQHKDQYNIRVLNISMYATPVAPYWADPYNLAVMAAWKAGIVVVTSAGNGGPAPLSIGVPGNTPYVITVGA
ncbi:MAG TPA: S8 family serine peptidase, partial [Anaerolineae bacterium]|nr:S8 family serine peptidase [Anaerolineae bacterium]